jgi:hypothetical protein
VGQAVPVPPALFLFVVEMANRVFEKTNPPSEKTNPIRQSQNF